IRRQDANSGKGFHQIADPLAVGRPRLGLSGIVDGVLSELVEQRAQSTLFDLLPRRCAPQPPAAPPITESRDSLEHARAAKKLARDQHRHARWLQNELLAAGVAVAVLLAAHLFGKASDFLNAHGVWRPRRSHSDRVIFVAMRTTSSSASGGWQCSVLNMR